MSKRLLCILAAGIIIQSCNYFKKKGNTIHGRDTTITGITSFNGLFLDSIHIDSFLQMNKQYEAYTDQFIDFYNHRNYEYAWFDKKGLAEQAFNFMDLQGNYTSDFQDSSLRDPKLDSLVNYLSTKPAKSTVNDATVIQTELMLTGQFFKYASKVYKGSDLDVEKLGWFIPRKKVDFAALLDSTLKAKARADDPYSPLNAQYKKLEENLSVYLGLEKKESKDTIPSVKKTLKKGEHSPVIVQIRSRLQLLKDLNTTDTSDVYDSSLVTGVKSFQKRMGLLVDGVIGNRMITELNVPVSQRIRQLLVNIERVRWMPAQKDSNYILVNIPEYKMHVFDGGKQSYDMDVIVGNNTNNTVIFKGNLKYIVFSPYWNVPQSIVEKEILPGIKKNPNYLAKNDMEITGHSNGLPEVRQKPGDKNSLGHVKFLFPNNYNIYFHDTPNRELFSLSKRDFSHGCIRLGEPKKFAEYLLRNDPQWDSEKIDSAMHQTKEKWVTIPKTIPVYITYFTAWVDAEGQLNFRKDIYGHDEKMSEKLFAKQ